MTVGRRSPSSTPHRTRSLAGVPISATVGFFRRQLQQMVDDVETRLALEIIDGAEIEQHRVAIVLERFEARAQLRGRNALDRRIVDWRTQARRIDRSAGDRRSLRARHGASSKLKT